MEHLTGKLTMPAYYDTNYWHYEPPKLKTKAEKLREEANAKLAEKNYYPGAVDQLDVFIVDQALGLDPRTVAGGSITKTGYMSIVLDDNGRRKHDVNGRTILEHKFFTPEQAANLVEWWDVLSDKAKAPNE